MYVKVLKVVGLSTLSLAGMTLVSYLLMVKLIELALLGILWVINNGC